MAFVHGKSTVVLANQYDLSAYFTDASWGAEVSADETTCFLSVDKTYIVGLGDAKISVSGLFDGTAVTGSDTILQAALKGSDVNLMTGVGGNVLGGRCKLAAGVETSYEVSEKVTDVVQIKADFQANAGMDGGVILAAARSVATATTTNETSVDNAASSSNGGVAQLHVTANASNNNTTVKVQHSVDNSVWVDLETFTVVATTVKTSERKVTAAATTVNRYLRATSTTAGTGAVVYTVAYARR